MAVHVTHHRGGFRYGWTDLTTTWEKEDGTGIGVAVLRLKPGELHDVSTEAETAYLLMSGKVEGLVGDEAFGFERRSLFDEKPSCLHVAAGQRINMSAHGEVELMVCAVDNDRRFPARVLYPGDVASQVRGRGQAGDAALSLVRIVFEGADSPEETMLALGEVLTPPGRWSGWPPQHQPQPEVRHYRFTRAEGWGHVDLGETVLKVRPYDTVKILPGNTHVQTTAPGYGMYAARVIRHLPEGRYVAPAPAVEHRWTMEPGAELWWPEELKPRD